MFNLKSAQQQNTRNFESDRLNNKNKNDLHQTSSQ